jgi:uncharacterized membrane protein YvbJ
MRPCQSCGTAVQNQDAVCHNCGADLKQRVEVTPVKVPSREAQREETMWLRVNLIAPSIIITLIVTTISVAAMGWVGLPVGLLSSAILSSFLFFVLHVM